MALTYDQFMNRIGKKTTFYKFLNKNRNHYDFQYKLGINIDTNEFNPHGSCQAGGLYFADNESVMQFRGYGDSIACITLLKDAQFYIDPEGSKYKTDKFRIDAIMENYWDCLRIHRSKTCGCVNFEDCDDCDFGKTPFLQMITTFLDTQSYQLTDEVCEYLRSVVCDSLVGLTRCAYRDRVVTPPCAEINCFNDKNRITNLVAMPLDRRSTNEAILQNLSEEQQTPFICRRAVIDDPESIQYVKNISLRQTLKNKYYVARKPG